MPRTVRTDCAHPAAPSMPTEVREEAAAPGATNVANDTFIVLSSRILEVLSTYRARAVT